jgi:hypothetical protein
MFRHHVVAAMPTHQPARAADRYSAYTVLSLPTVRPFGRPVAGCGLGGHEMGDGTSAAAAGGAPGRDMAPGGPRAMAHGCLCSVLANAAYRSGADEAPIVDPRCPLHAES